MQTNNYQVTFYSHGRTNKQRNGLSFGQGEPAKKREPHAAPPKLRVYTETDTRRGTVRAKTNVLSRLLRKDKQRGQVFNPEGIGESMAKIFIETIAVKKNTEYPFTVKQLKETALRKLHADVRKLNLLVRNEKATPGFLKTFR